VRRRDSPVELKPMTVPRPKLTLEQAAMESVTDRVAGQPRLHVRRADVEPQLVYTRGIYRPQPVYWRGTADSHGFSFLHNSSQDSRSRDLDQTNDDDEEDEDDSPGPGDITSIIIIIIRRCKNVQITRMWASARRDGRPAEYRWRRLFNAVA